ncbi:unnamed protein product, partial [Phaeothamnion confervicola]
LDGSPAAEKALPFAEELAKAHGGQLHLVSVCSWASTSFPAEAGYYISPELIEAQLKSQDEYLTKVQLDLHERGLEAKTYGLEGNALQRLLEFAESHKVDLIVLTSHGRTAFKRFLLGSVAENVARLAPCPVLLVGHESFANAK